MQSCDYRSLKGTAAKKKYSQLRVSEMVDKGYLKLNYDFQFKKP